ncbi:MAG: hypothetical protein HGB11_10500 [Chlorobiales bacterium]|nr:hypothetical protein [Chlorobiales bacterium]
MLSKLTTLWRPEVYHGHSEKRDFFEGWFFKLVDPSLSHIYAVIPGVMLSKSHQDSHAFIQLLNGQTKESAYYRFPLNDFSFSKKEFQIRIGENFFSSNHLKLNLSGQSVSISGELQLENLKPWPVTLLNPGAMGPYAFAPFMECYHGVLSMDHRIKGSLTINDETENFDSGKGYMEKDWGRSFPSAYIWLQCNHFGTDGMSLMASVAKIPWLTGAFRGFLIAFLYDGKLYRFTTYTGAKLRQVDLTDDIVMIEVADKTHMLRMTAARSHSGVMHGPYGSQMVKKVSESLNATVSVEFYENQQRIFEGTGRAAGLDVNGNLEEIVG